MSETEYIPDEVLMNRIYKNKGSKGNAGQRSRGIYDVKPIRLREQVKRKKKPCSGLTGTGLQTLKPFN